MGMCFFNTTSPSPVSKGIIELGGYNCGPAILIPWLKHQNSMWYKGYIYSASQFHGQSLSSAVGVYKIHVIYNKVLKSIECAIIHC